MSAFMVARHHIAYIVVAAHSPAIGFNDAFCVWGPTLDKDNDFNTDHRVKMARLLELENARSICYRYPQDKLDDQLSEWSVADLRSAQWPTLDPVQVIKSVQCYQYQACEHPGWEESAAKLITDRIKARAVDSLPGYDGALWGAPEPASKTVA